MRILKIVGIVVAAIIALVLIIPAFLPSTAHVERSAVIKKPISEVYTYMGDFKHFVAWNPWSAMEPSAKTTVSEPSSGVGAKYTWEGKETGSGHMTLTKVETDKQIDMDLVFTAPWQSKAKVSYILKPAEAGTQVTWTYDGEMGGYMMRWFGLTMDGMLGGQYEQGLKSLAEKLEAMPAPQPTDVKAEEKKDEKKK